MRLEDGFSLGEWQVEPESLRLHQGERTVTLEAKTMGVLLCLAGKPGATVTSDELIQAVWDGRPMADNPVYKAIAKLRQALGDDSRKPRYIETITKRGYRLIGPVAPLKVESPTSTEGAPMRAPHRRRLRYRSTSVLTAVALAFVLVLALLEYVRDTPHWPSGRPPTLTKLVDLPGSNFAPAAAPDGRRIVFLNDRGQGTDLWMLDTESDELMQLTNNLTPIGAPTWSPGGDRILFHLGRNLWQIESGEDYEPSLLIENATHGAWSPDGERIVFERGTELWLSRSDGLGQVRIQGVPERDQFFEPRAPVFTPDGASLVFFEASQGPLGHLLVIDLLAGQLRQLTSVEMLGGKPTVTADGDWVIFHSQDGESQSLWRIPFEGGEAEVLLPGTSDDANPVVLRHGEHRDGEQSIVYESTRALWSLMATNPENDEEIVLAESRRAIAAAEVSPDGNMVSYFRVLADGTVQVFVKDMAGGVPRQLTHSGRVNVMPRWSGDGEWIYVYHSAAAFSWQRVSRVDGHMEMLAPGWNFNREHDATANPSGDHVVYALLESDIVLETRLRNLVTGAERTLPIKASWFDWSKDGAWLVATSFGASKLPVGAITLCDMHGSTPTCEQIADRGQHPVWAQGDSRIVFVDPLGKTRLRVWQYDVSAKSLRQLTELAPVAVSFNPFVDVTDDGRLVWVRHVPGQVELWQAAWR